MPVWVNIDHTDSLADKQSDFTGENFFGRIETFPVPPP